MENPFLSLETKLDALAVDIRALKARTTNATPADEVGGMDLFMKVTGYARQTGYKLSHLGQVPCMKRGGKLFFKRSELEAWIEAGRRKTAAEVAEERMSGKNEKAQRA